jgi:hypothetical protein
MCGRFSTFPTNWAAYASMCVEYRGIACHASSSRTDALAGCPANSGCPTSSTLYAKPTTACNYSAAWLSQAIGMYSGEGEYVPFVADCSCTGPVETWLQVPIFLTFHFCLPAWVFAHTLLHSRALADPRNWICDFSQQRNCKKVNISKWFALGHQGRGGGAAIDILSICCRIWWPAMW